VEAFARERGATPFMVLLAAFQAVLGRWAGTDVVVVGTSAAIRDEAELEPLIGPFAHTLALRGDLSGDPTFHALVDRARETTLAAHMHQDLPFETLADELGIERPAPVLQVMFILRDAPATDAPRSLGEVEAREMAGVPGRSAYDLTLALHEGEDAFAGTMEYAVDLFDAATVERMAVQLEALLSAALDAPEIALSALPLPDAEHLIAVDP
jgi:non-ribosomal peptide synthetase component F